LVATHLDLNETNLGFVATHRALIATLLGVGRVQSPVD
jgi:hypothetical protein